MSGPGSFLRIVGVPGEGTQAGRASSSVSLAAWSTDPRLPAHLLLLLS